ncbi:MAG: hypothetical protein FJ290_14895 [Planctomycetes bacterium]|nr:hypothetical protein [Planctomycetota bacterium]
MPEDAIKAGGGRVRIRQLFNCTAQNYYLRALKWMADAGRGTEGRMKRNEDMGGPHPIKLMHCDLNWAIDPYQRPAAPHDWASVDPEEYFNWHLDIGTNVMYCQAYIFGGTALYPTRLGPLALGTGALL